MRRPSQLKEKLEQGVRQGLLLSDINYDLAITVFSYSLFGVMSDNRMELPDNVSEAEAFRYIVTYFFRGIATTKGIEIIDDYINKVKKDKTNNE